MNVDVSEYSVFRTSKIKYSSLKVFINLCQHSYCKNHFLKAFFGVNNAVGNIPCKIKSLMMAEVAQPVLLHISLANCSK